MVGCQLLFALRNFIYFQNMHATLGKAKFMMPVILMATAVLWLLTAKGVWNERKWASNLVLLPALFMLLTMVLIAGRSWALHWTLFISWALEVLTLFAALIQVARVPSENWKAMKLKGWRKMGQVHLWALAFWLLCQLEIWLIVGGLYPGQLFGPKYFHLVDVLVQKQDYTTGEDGIMRLNELGVEVASKGTFMGKDLGIYNPDLPYSASTYSLFEDLLEMRKGNHENAFTHMVDSLGSVPDSLKTSVDSAYLAFRDFPINHDGFRSIPFKRFSQKKRKTVLLIGDSFTFGWSARPWTGAFADELSSLGYIVYNAGITATDPPQYSQVAKKYIPILKPDVVIVNLFLGNDVMHYPREAGPFRMAYYPTNAGVMMAAPKGEYFKDAETAYQHFIEEYFIPNDGGWFSDVCGKTTIGTLAWKVAQRLGVLRSLNLNPNEAYHSRNRSSFREKPYTERYLKTIVEIAEQEGSRCLISVIPEINNPQPDLAKDYPMLFEELNYVLPSMEYEDFNPGEEHFNLQGHQKYARFLKQQIEKIN